MGEIRNNHIEQGNPDIERQNVTCSFSYEVPRTNPTYANPLYYSYEEKKCSLSTRWCISQEKN